MGRGEVNPPYPTAAKCLTFVTTVALLPSASAWSPTYHSANRWHLTCVIERTLDSMQVGTALLDVIPDRTGSIAGSSCDQPSQQLVMRTSPDRHLLESWRANRDEAAFQILCERHASMVAAMSRRLGSPDPEEAAQAVFILLAQRPESINDPDHLLSWLMGSVRGVVANQRRARIRRRRHEREAAEVQQMQHLAKTKEPSWEDARPQLDEALAAISPGQREAVVRFYLQNKSQVDVAAELGCSVDAVKNRVHVGLENLRAFFVQRGVTLGAAALASGLTSEAAASEPAIVSACTHAGLTPTVAPGAAAIAQSMHAGWFTTVMGLSLTTKITFGLIAILTLSTTPFLLLSGGTSAVPIGAVYVNSANPLAHDHNPGTKDAPWLTIQHAVNVAKPGDTIMIMPGQYGRTVIAVSGTKEQPITITGVMPPSQSHVQKDQLLDPLQPHAFPGNPALNAVTQGFDVAGARWGRITNFEITAVQQATAGVFLRDADNITISNNFFHDLNPEQGNHGGIRSDTHNVKNIVIRDNTLFRCQGTTLCIIGENWLVEGNELSHGTNCRSDTGANTGGEDAVLFFGSGHVLRYNYLHDYLDEEQVPNSGAASSAFQTYSVSPNVQFASDILIEKNYCYNFGQIFMCEDQAEVKSAGNRVHHLTFKNNVFRKTGAWAVQMRNKSDHATFINNVFSETFYGGLIFGEESHHATVINNIFYNCYSVQVKQGQPPSGPLGFDASCIPGSTADYNLYSHDYTWPYKNPGFDTHSTYAIDPKFINAKIGDYRLQPDSPAIGAGDPSLLSANGKRMDIGAAQSEAPDKDWILRWIHE